MNLRDNEESAQISKALINAQNLKTILQFRNCFRTEDASTSPPIPYSHITLNGSTNPSTIY